MQSSWKSVTGHLVCRWSEAGKRVPYDPQWMREAVDAQGSHFPPMPDFAAHSPFGGPSWFDRFRHPLIPGR